MRHLNEETASGGLVTPDARKPLPSKGYSICLQLTAVDDGLLGFDWEFREERSRFRPYHIVRGILTCLERRLAHEHEVVAPQIRKEPPKSIDVSKVQASRPQEQRNPSGNGRRR